jgi:rhamnulose-1-phosphate aldolase
MEELLEAVGRTARDLWDKGWAERNAGNLSLRLRPERLGADFAHDPPWHALTTPVPNLGGEHLLFTATGGYMRNVELDASRNLHIIEIDEAGERHRVVWGRGAGPTSELMPHLRAHAARVTVTNGRDRAVIHTHPPHLIALTFALDLDTARLTRLLWEMHTECIVVFPAGCGFIGWKLPGSDELAEATAQTLTRRPMTVWQYHGIVAAGESLDAAFGLIDTAEKAAAIYLEARSLGPLPKKLSVEQLTALARHFRVEPDPEILPSR